MSVCLPLTPESPNSGTMTAVATQRLGEHVPAVMNVHATIEMLDALFSMRSVSYEIACSERKGGD
jgi:hypothetical protein